MRRAILLAGLLTVAACEETPATRSAVAAPSAKAAAVDEPGALKTAQAKAGLIAASPDLAAASWSDDPMPHVTLRNGRAEIFLQDAAGRPGVLGQMWYTEGLKRHRAEWRDGQYRAFMSMVTTLDPDLGPGERADASNWFLKAIKKGDEEQTIRLLNVSEISIEREPGNLTITGVR